MTHRNRTLRSVVATSLVCAVALLGCHRYPAPPRHPTDDPAFAERLDVRPKGMDDAPPEAIKVLPGDVLRVRTISAEETAYEGLVVDELGSVHVPLVGDVEVGEQTLTEAELRIQKALRRYDSVVRVSVEITEPAGHRITVVGAITAPGVHTVVPGMRLAELLARAGAAPGMGAGGGGVTAAVFQTPDLQAARLVRNGEILPVSIPLALAGEPRHNIRVRAGDHLFIPPARGDTITVLGEAAAPQVLIYRQSMRLSHVLALAGGLPHDARMRDVRVIRGPMDEPSIYKVSQRSLGRGNAVDVEMAPGDIVYVGRRSLAEMREVLSAFGPILATGLSVGLAVGLSQ